eukprot:s2253_g6.t4
MGRGGIALNTGAYRELRSTKGKGKGQGAKGGKGSGKSKGKLAFQKKLLKKKAQKAEAKKNAQRESSDEEVDTQDVFWRPTWDTLGPLQEPSALGGEVKEKGDMNRLGRKREKTGKDDFGFGVLLNRAPVLRSKKSLEASAEEADAPEPGQSRRGHMGCGNRLSMVRSSSATVAALARCLIGSHVVLAWSPTASDFAAAALAARSDFRWRAFETSGYRFPDETHFDELDWNTGFAELWLYALRAARLALPESAGGLLRAAKEVRSVRSEKRLHRSFVAAGKAFDRIAEKLRSLVNVTPSVAPATCTPASSTVNRSIRLSNDLQMPVLGLGTTMLNGASGKEAILAALREGYRLIDTAQAYENEAEVGEAILESGIPRSEIFVATKLSEDGDCKPGRAKARVRAQLKLLKTSYIDQYMLHGPCPGMVEAWKDLEELYDAGVLRSLGVSNFDYTQLRRFLGQVRIAPHVVQNKFSIYHRGWAPVDPLRDLAEVFRKEGMAVMGYCNLDAYPHVLQPLEDIFVWRIASRCGRTPAQVLLRHALQHGTVVIPKSERPERLRENADIFDFELSPEDMLLILADPGCPANAGAPRTRAQLCRGRVRLEEYGRTLRRAVAGLARSWSVSRRPSIADRRTELARLHDLPAFWKSRTGGPKDMASGCTCRKGRAPASGP